MSEVKDYTSDAAASGDTHYNGVPSAFGRRVEEQNKMQPKYCDPGQPDGQMKGEKSNVQAGP